MGLSRTVSEVDGDFSRKSQKFSTLVIFVPAEGVPLDIGAGVKKTRMMGLLGRERSLTISLAVWIQSTNVTDRQTTDGQMDRRTDGHRQQQRPRLRIASRGKKNKAPRWYKHY